jgi:hypothetical protein
MTREFESLPSPSRLAQASVAALSLFMFSLVALWLVRTRVSPGVGFALALVMDVLVLSLAHRAGLLNRATDRIELFAESHRPPA